MRRPYHRKRPFDNNSIKKNIDLLTVIPIYKTILKKKEKERNNNNK